MNTLTPSALFQTWCIYGPSGGGKTTLSATAPKPIVMDSNQGLLSIAGRPGFEHVCGEDIHTFRNLERAYTYCTGTSKKQDWSKKFETIIFDHFDDIQAIVLNELGEAAAKKDERRNADMIEQREWGIMGSRLKRYLRKFKRVPMHKILICSETEGREDGILRPNLTGQLRDQLPYFCDNVAYLRIGKGGRRFLHLDPTDDFYAKTRAWWLPPEARKIEITFNDTTALTKLFALIAAGPKGATPRSATTPSTKRSK